MVEFRLLRLHLPNGRCPFADWFDSLPRHDRWIVDSRLLRLQRGNFGEINTIGGGVWELKFHRGAGLSIYYARVGKQVLLLLAGGDKGSQNKDIQHAKKLFVAYEKEKLKNENL